MTFQRAIRFQSATFLLLLVAVLAGGLVLHRQDVRIQAQRRDSIRTICEQTNERNRNTKQIVRDRVSLALKTAPLAGRQALIDGEGFTLLLIDALAPVQNCSQLVKERTST